MSPGVGGLAIVLSTGGRSAVDNERTLRVLAAHQDGLDLAREVLSDEVRQMYYQRTADILTSKYIQSSLDWDTYQLALSTLRRALAVPPVSEHEDRAD